MDVAFKDLYERQNNKIMKITNSIQNKITSFQKLFSKENKEELETKNVDILFDLNYNIYSELIEIRSNDRKNRKNIIPYFSPTPKFKSL